MVRITGLPPCARPFQQQRTGSSRLSQRLGGARAGGGALPSRRLAPGRLNPPWPTRQLG